MTRRISIQLLAVSLVLTCMAGVHAQVGRNMGVLNPNTATEAALRALPHMTAARAATIVDGAPVWKHGRGPCAGGASPGHSRADRTLLPAVSAVEPERDDGRRDSLGARCRRTHGP